MSSKPAMFRNWLSNVFQATKNKIGAKPILFTVGIIAVVAALILSPWKPVAHWVKARVASFTAPSVAVATSATLTPSKVSATAVAKENAPTSTVAVSTPSGEVFVPAKPIFIEPPRRHIAIERQQPYSRRTWEDFNPSRKGVVVSRVEFVDEETVTEAYSLSGGNTYGN